MNPVEELREAAQRIRDAAAGPWPDRRRLGGERLMRPFVVWRAAELAARRKHAAPLWLRVPAALVFTGGALVLVSDGRWWAALTAPLPAFLAAATWLGVCVAWRDARQAVVRDHAKRGGSR